MPRKKKTKKKKKEPEFFQDESSISELAAEFLQSSKLGDQSATVAGLDPFAEALETRHVSATDPTRVGTIATFLWGGGFLYLRQPLVASVALFLILLFGTLFGAMAGVFPQKFSVLLLRDLHWQFSLGPSLIWTGFPFAFFWWASICVPTWICFREQSGRRHKGPTPWFVFFLAPLPILGPLFRGSFYRMAISALGLFLVLVSTLSLLRLWTAAGIALPEETALLDAYFLPFFLTFMAGVLSLLVDLFSGLVWILRQVGWLRDQSQGEQTEWLFVGLGSGLVLLVMAYLFVGQPGRNARNHLHGWAERIEDRSLEATAKHLRRPIRAWERQAETVQDFLSLMQ